MNKSLNGIRTLANIVQRGNVSGVNVRPAYPFMLENMPAWSFYFTSATNDLFVSMDENKAGEMYVSYDGGTYYVSPEEAFERVADFLQYCS